MLGIASIALVDSMKRICLCLIGTVLTVVMMSLPAIASPGDSTENADVVSGDSQAMMIASSKPQLIITAVDQTYIYNGEYQGEGDTVYEEPAQIAEKVKVEGLQDGDALTSVVLDGQGRDIGTYPIVPSNATIGNNTEKYDITYVNGTLTITNSHNVAVAVNPAGSGEVTGGGKYEPNSKVDLTATPATGYRFVDWKSEDVPEINGVTNDKTSFSMLTNDVAITANFKDKAKLIVALTKDGEPQGGLGDYLYLVAEDGSRLGVEFAYSGMEGRYVYDPVATLGDQLASGNYILKFDPPASSNYTASSIGLSYCEDVYQEITTFEYYTVKFVNYDGTILQSRIYDLGQVPEYSGATPIKPATTEYTYAFKAWDPPLAKVTGSATYKATFSEMSVPPKPKGVLTFDLGGGMIDGKTTLTIEANVGDVITIPGAPTRDGYTFKYWEGSVYYPGEKYTVEGDHTFTAMWEKNAPAMGTTTTDIAAGGTTVKGTPKTCDYCNAFTLVLVACAGITLCMLALKRHRGRGHIDK